MPYALALFAATYVLMLIFAKHRALIALASAAVFILTGMLPPGQLLPSIDLNVLLMIAGTMGLVQLFIESKMPERLAELIMERVPNVQAAAVALALFAGVTNCPISTLLIGFALFGYGAMPYFVFVIAVSFTLSGYYSLYSSEKFVYSKTRTEYINRKTNEFVPFGTEKHSEEA